MLFFARLQPPLQFITPDQFSSLVQTIGLWGALSFMALLIVGIAVFGWQRREGAKMRIRLRELENAAAQQSSQSKVEELEATQNSEIIKQWAATQQEYINTNKALYGITQQLTLSTQQHNTELSETRRVNEDFHNIIKALVDNLTTMPITLASLLSASMKEVAENNLVQYNLKQTQITQAISDLENESGEMREQIEALKTEVHQIIEWTKTHDEADVDRAQIILDALLSIQAKLDKILKSTAEFPAVENDKPKGET